MSNKAIGNIVDLMPGSVQVKVEDVKPGDSVFDPMGRTYPIKSVRPFKHVVHLRRYDLPYADSFEMGSLITIMRAAS